MFRIIFVLTLLINAFFIRAQSLSIDTLYQIEKRVFLAKNDTLKNSFRLEKFNYCLATNPFDTLSYKEANRVEYSMIENSNQKSNFLWNSTLICIIYNDFMQASFLYEKYEQQMKDSSVQSLLLGFAANKKYPEVQQNYLQKLVQKDSLFKELDCFRNLSKDTIHEAKFLRLAKIVPGLGLIKMNEKKRGYFSLTTNALLTTAVVTLAFNELYINAIAVSYIYLYRFYQGNIALTKRAIEQKRNRKKNELTISCELVLKNLLTKYSIGFIL